MCHCFSFRKLTCGMILPAACILLLSMSPHIFSGTTTTCCLFYQLWLSKKEAMLAASSHHGIVCFLFTILATLSQGLGQDIIYLYLLASAQLLWERCQGRIGIWASHVQSMCFGLRQNNLQKSAAEKKSFLPLFSQGSVQYPWPYLPCAAICVLPPLSHKGCMFNLASS